MGPGSQFFVVGRGQHHRCVLATELYIRWWWSLDDVPDVATINTRIRHRRHLSSLDHATLEVELQAHSPLDVVLILIAHELLLLAEPLYQIECSCALPNAWRACEDECQRLCSLATAPLHQVKQLPVAGPHVQASAERCWQVPWQIPWQAQASVLLFQVHQLLGPLGEKLAGQASCWAC